MRRGPCEFCVMAPICKSEEVACGLFAQFVLPIRASGGFLIRTG